MIPSDFDPEFMDIHYGHELRQMLVGAVNWHAARQPGHREVPPHLENLGEDAVFLHGRNLYDLFVMDKGEHRRQTMGMSSPLTTALYDQDFITAVHEKSLHVGPTRPYAPTGSSADDLPKRVLDVANDVLDIWDRAQVAPQMHSAFRIAMVEARRRAILEARREAAWYRIDDVFE